VGFFCGLVVFGYAGQKRRQCLPACLLPPFGSAPSFFFVLLRVCTPPTMQVTQIDPRWLVELAPRFFKGADPHKLSRRKRMERIEPLYDRFNDPNEWRLSKRRG
jgi:hypothetical protein